MGFTPQQVDAMSLWQWLAALNGYADAHSGKDGAKLTEAEAEDLFDWIEANDNGPKWLKTQTYWWEGPWPEPMGVVEFEAARR